MNIKKFQRRQIEIFTQQYYSKLDFAHNIDHMNKTIKIAVLIAKKEKADLQTVKIGSMLHQFHDDIPKLKKFLEKIKLSKHDISELLEFAKFRPFKKGIIKNPSLEVKVVFDADALQVIGPYGILREVCCNIKSRSKEWHKSVKDAKNVEKKFYNSLQTKTGKNLGKQLISLTENFWREYDYYEEL